MRRLAADEIDRLLTFPALIDALHAAFTDGMVAPDRHHHQIGAGPAAPVHLLMPAWTGDAPAPGSFLGVKVVNVFPGNGRLGLPSVSGTYLLHAGDTGSPLLAADGTRLTLWRTAAASGLASRFLARPDARRLLMVGAGALAPFLVRAHAAVRPLERVDVWNRSPEAAGRLVASLAESGLAATVADDLEAAVGTADIVSCATLAATPLLRGAWLRPGTHVDLVGAFTMAMREADDEALRRASLFVDTEAALHEGGDVAVALAAGAIDRGSVRATLVQLCAGTAPGRTAPEEVTLFKSVGTATEDLAAAMLLWRALANPS